MTRRHQPAEIVKILAEGESGDVSRPEIYRRRKITKATYYRWRKEYIRSERELALILEAKDADFYECESIALTHQHLRDLADPNHPLNQMEVALDSMSTEEWERFRQEMHDAYVAFEAKEKKEIRRRAHEEKKFKAMLKRALPVQHQLAHRFGSHRVKVHGRLPRGQFTTVNIHLPEDLHWRLTKQVDGSLNQSIPALLRYALDCLDAEAYMLHVFDARKGGPANVKYTNVLERSNEELERQKELRRRIHPGGSQTSPTIRALP